MKTNFLTAAACALLLASQLSATISFDIEMEQLRTSVPTPVGAPTSTLVMLIADTNNNGFGTIQNGRSLTVGSFLNSGGDDQILYKNDIATTTATLGVFADFPTLTLSGAWGAGDPLAIVWFPEYTTSTTQTTMGGPYGLYFNSTPGVDGSDSWITPSDGAFGHKLYLFTSAATVIHSGGSNPASAGNASFLVTPEPSLSCLSLLGVASIFMRRRRQTNDRLVLM